MNRIFEQTTTAGAWRAEAQTLLESGTVSADYQSAFHTYWTEAGHRIREQINDDPLLASMLKIALPPYDGDWPVLYRGENAARWNEGRVGFCWSAKIETARMFGRGLNAIKSGGVLLKVHAPNGAVLAGPSQHSHYLGEGEFTLNPLSLTKIEKVEDFDVHP